jgi:hypothetical protein
MVLLKIKKYQQKNGCNLRQHDKGTTLFQLIPAREFHDLCDRFQINLGVRRLTAQKQVWALVMAFIFKLESLREIELTLGIPKSTLSDANANREAQFFEELCRLVLWRIYAHLRGRKYKQALRTILALDSTDCRAHGSLSKLPKWKTKSCSKVGGKASAKLHVMWNLDGEWIEEFRITAGRVNDSPAAKCLKIRPNCTYVFDRAYNELTFWWSIVRKKSHFVTRLKKCSYSKWRHQKLLRESVGKDGVLRDWDWKPSYPVLRKAPQVPKDFKLRHITFRDPLTKKVFDFITSDFEASAETIAAIYKKRWAVELLFRWLKGHLGIRTLDARNTNAIKVQLAIGVLVQLLIQLHRMLKKFPGTLWEYLRILRTQWTKSAINQMIAHSPHFNPFVLNAAPTADVTACYY